jgi:hypothetical protein
MGRGSRGLVVVLGMLWLAASASASTLWNGEASLLLGSRIGEDNAALWVGDYPGVWVGAPITIHRIPSSYEPRQLVSYDRRAAGAPRFGRRDFIWHPSPVPFSNRYVNRSPGSLGGPTLYHPLERLLGFRDNGVYADRWPQLLGEDPSSSLLFRQRLAELSWRTLRDLVVLPLPYVNEPVLDFIDRRGAKLIMVDDRGPGLDLLRVGLGREAYALLPGLDTEPWLGDFNVPYELWDFGSASVVVNAAPIPEPATGALLLAGLCALSARRRLR